MPARLTPLALVVVLLIPSLRARAQPVAQGEQHVPRGPEVARGLERPKASKDPIPAGEQWQAKGARGVVVTGGSEAAAAGVETMKAGGNAFDGAAATLLALTVTDAHNFSFGSEMAAIVYDARRGVAEVVCGQGAAPRLATREHFVRTHGGKIPASGPESATVPAAPDAIVTILDRYGTITFEKAAAPALRILGRGEQAWHANYARTLRRMIDAERGGGGDRTRGLRLAGDCFYRGPVAREIDAWSRANGGLLRYTDLATHVTRVEDPVAAEYRGHTVYKCGPWSQGPWLLQALSMLQPADLKAAGHNSARGIHVAVEAVKLAMADRDAHFADPLFEDVPLKELLSPGYLEKRRALIDSSRASIVARPGDPRAGKPLLEANRSPASEDSRTVYDTTNCLVADAAGNVAAITPSGWGGALAGETGVWLGSRLQSFDMAGDHPNRLEPGKRPRTTLTPTLVLRDGKPVMAVSVAGGDAQDQVALQVLVNMIDHGMPPAEAVTAPRFMTNHFTSSFGQKPPELGSLIVNPEIGPETIARLRELGHQVRVQEKYIWEPTALRIDWARKTIDGAGDPKAARHAAGY